VNVFPYIAETEIAYDNVSLLAVQVRRVAEGINICQDMMRDSGDGFEQESTGSVFVFVCLQKKENEYV